MKRILCIAVAAVAAMAFSPAQEASAQSGFGGCGYGFGFNNFRYSSERPPYFALYPPVYYSNQIVRRPMGVSPFAAPPGVTPVEMSMGAMSAKIVNPYFNKTAPVKQTRKEAVTDEDT